MRQSHFIQALYLSYPSLWCLVRSTARISPRIGRLPCVLPSGGAAGKDMGIWHVSLVLPQIVGSAVIGWMITELSPWITTRFAYASAFALCGLLPVAASVLINRIRCTKDTADIEVVPDAVSPAG